jgi:ferric-dicitrate binding protein FerR (iron transport regulator)
MKDSKWSEQTRLEATEWVILLNAPDGGDEDPDSVVTRFKAWLRASPDNDPAFCELQETFDTLLTLHDPADWGFENLPDDSLHHGTFATLTENSASLGTPSSQVSRAVPAYQDRLDDMYDCGQHHSEHRLGRAWHPKWRGMLAAGVVLLVAGSAYLYRAATLDPCHAPSTDSSAGCVFSKGLKISPAGKVSLLQLADSSHVEVQGVVLLDVTYDHRHVELQRGEALFKVAKSTVTFEVIVGNGLVRAVGTAFRVRKIGVEGFETLVSDGVVEVFAANQQHLTLHAGEGAQFDGSLLRKLTNTPSQHESQPAAPPRFNFQSVRLDEAARLFNRRNPKIVLTVDAAIAGLTIGGSPRPTQPSSLMWWVQRWAFHTLNCATPSKAEKSSCSASPIPARFILQTR